MRHLARFIRRIVPVFGAGAIAAGLLGGCGSGSSASTQTSGSSSGGGPQVALLLPDNETARYEGRDRPTFTAALKNDCPSCTLLYSNAAEDASKQQAQAEAALTNGADVLVVDPVDSDSAASIVAKAKQQQVPVISYDRLINNADLDYVVKFNNVRQGVVQAQALVRRLREQGKPHGSIVMINGSPADANSKPLKQGAHSVIDDSGLRVVKEYDTPDWSPAEAQKEMEQAITAVGKSNIDGVYVANDGMAGGAIAALKGAGFDPFPPVTGLDAEVDAVKRILRGEQYMTVYLNIEREARTAARMAAAVAHGSSLPAGLITGKLDNGQKAVPGALLQPTPVTKQNLERVVFKSGYLKAATVCTGDLKTACASAGIR